MDYASDFVQARSQMVREQLARRGIRQPAVLEAIERVPRERFVAVAEAAEAYADRALTIDCGQTISQPYMVGLMTQALELSGRERVLEIGTGSGYQTAILAELAREVISVERHAALSRQAAALLGQLGYTNIRLAVGDGTLGWPPAAPYDRILVTAAAGEVPPALWEQLSSDGLLVIPLGDSEGQVLKRYRKQSEGFEADDLVHCRFVPLIGSASPPRVDLED
ncbi:MAG: protein-L-isoaspartate(D-aspartate) O-methyltransferase [Pirellulales bacterium]